MPDQLFTLEKIVTILFDGTSIGSVLLLAALGLAIVFGLMGVINLAHGELIMLGAYATYVVQNVAEGALPNFEYNAALGFASNAIAFCKSNDAYIFYALPIAFLVSGLVGLILERGAIRFLYGRPLETLLATWGVSLILRQSVRSVNWVLALGIVLLSSLFFALSWVLKARDRLPPQTWQVPVVAAGIAGIASWGVESVLGQLIPNRGIVIAIASALGLYLIYSGAWLSLQRNRGVRQLNPWGITVLGCLCIPAAWGLGTVVGAVWPELKWLPIAIRVGALALLGWGVWRCWQCRSNLEPLQTRWKFLAFLLALGTAIAIPQRLAQVYKEPLTKAWFGSQNLRVAAPGWLQGGVGPENLPSWLGWLRKGLESIGLEGFRLPSSRLFIIALTIACIVAIYWFLNGSNWGLRIRAVTQNRSMSACLGIPTNTVDALTFSLGSGLAGIAGCAITLIGAVGPNIGGNYIVDAFMVVVVGGVGKIVGSIAAAIAIGITNYIISTEQLVPVVEALQAQMPAIAKFWQSIVEFLEVFGTPSMAKVLVFALIITFLQIKPAGLFPQKGRTAEL